MERTIKNFNKFTKDLWEEFAMNFLNSIDPNPFEVLGNLDDISLEYDDMGYSFFPALEIINLRDDWSVDILYSELTAKKYKEPSEKIIKYCPGTEDNFKLVKYIESGDYQLTYKLCFLPKNKFQLFGEMLDEFCYPIMGRIKSEYSLDELFFLISFVNGNSNERYQLYDHPFPKKGYFSDKTLESRIGTLIITTKIE